MIKVLLTAFEPYGPWKENASWLAVMELTRDLPSPPAITTRRYPVNFSEVRNLLQSDIRVGYDVVLHLGQAPTSSHVQLESIAVNVGGEEGQRPSEFEALEPTGPVAFRSELPLSNWSELLRHAEIPAKVSFHAGTYLCNACLYWTHFFANLYEVPTKATFLHLPLATSQVISQQRDEPSMSTNMITKGLQLILEDINERFSYER